MPVMICVFYITFIFLICNFYFETYLFVFCLHHFGQLCCFKVLNTKSGLDWTVKCWKLNDRVPAAGGDACLCYLCQSAMCRLLNALLALLSRLLFAIHGVVTVWRVVAVKQEPLYWLLLTGVALLGLEMAVTLKCTRNAEWKW